METRPTFTGAKYGNDDGRVTSSNDSRSSGKYQRLNATNYTMQGKRHCQREPAGQ